MLIGMIYTTISSGALALFAEIDHAVYFIISLALNGLYSISKTTIDIDILDKMRTRIYIILGVFMLFKLAFSLLNGIINPDKIADKQAGMQKIIIRVVITMSLLLTVPSIFETALTVQDHILRALPQIILGPNQTYDDTSVGRDIANATLKAFVSKNDDCEAVDELNIDLDNISTEVVKKCKNDGPGGVKIFMYKYTFLLSTLVGLVMIIFIVLCCIDVAIRVLKFSILQIIAPIPIMSYIDPKSEKDGAFSNWVKECISTYISLFVQLGVIYFVVYLISTLSRDILDEGVTSPISFGGGNTAINIWVFIFLVIGALFFMRQASKFILKVLGIKDGTILGIGMAAGISGFSALRRGGVPGALLATGSSLFDGAAANAEGKSALTGARQRGRDIAEQMRTGNSEAKGITFNDRMKNIISRRALGNQGITGNSIKAEKENINIMNQIISQRQQDLSNLNSLSQMYSSRKNIDAQLSYYNSLGNSITSEQQSQKDALEAKKVAINSQINTMESTTLRDYHVNEQNIDSSIVQLSDQISTARDNIQDATSKFNEAKGKYKATQGTKPVSFGDVNKDNMYTRKDS